MVRRQQAQSHLFRKPKCRPVPSSILNRELSLLAFNERVLAMAARTSVPLAERLRYICIVSSNLDEFFEVRMSDLSEEIRETRGASPQASVYAGILDRAHRLVEAQYALFNHTIMPALERRGIVVLNNAQRNDEQRAWVREYFMREVRPLLSPIGLDPSHPFPQVLNKSLNFILQLEGKDAFGRPSATAILKVPRVLPRVIPLPTQLAPGKQAFVLLSSVIRVAPAGGLSRARDQRVFAVSRDARFRSQRRRARGPQPAPGAAHGTDAAALRQCGAPRGAGHLSAAPADAAAGAVPVAAGGRIPRRRAGQPGAAESAR